MRANAQKIFAILMSGKKRDVNYILRAVNCHNEMLEALKHALDRLNVVSRNYEGTDFGLIQRAIAKAEGKL